MILFIYLLFILNIFFFLKIVTCQADVVRCGRGSVMWQ